MKKILLTTLIVLLITWGILALWPRPQAIDTNPFRKEPGALPHIIAHGGGNHEFPDNTLEAYYNAYSVDANIILETDVALTQDGVLILTHDRTLDRKTTLQYATVSEINYSDLVADQIDFGYENPIEPRANGFNVTGTLNRYTNYKGEHVTPHDVTYPEGVYPRHETKFLVTTLEELIIAFPNTRIIVEIKQTRDVGARAVTAMIELFDRLDEDYNTYARIAVGSFHQDIYEQYVRLKETTHPQLLFSAQEHSLLRFYVLQHLRMTLFFASPATSFELPMRQMNLSLTTNSVIQTARRHNIAVNYWTINDPDDMRYLIGRDVDGIMTDRPQLMKSILEEIESQQ